MDINTSLTKQGGCLKQQDKKIHLVLISDRNYFNFILIAITSVVYYHRTDDLVIHFLHPDLTEEDFAAVEKIKTIAPFEFNPVQIDLQKFASDFGSSRAILWRLAIPEYLPEVDKIIYCDCDMVFCDDIAKLWQEDLDGKILGACGDRVGRKISHIYPIDESKYFNSGVMIWDLKRMRDEKAEAEWQRVMKEYNGNIRYADQTLLNMVYNGGWVKLLHPRWNLHNSVYRNMPVEGMYSVQEIVEAIKNPGIIHYTGHHKPWTFFKFTHHPYAHRFWHFALMAPVSKLYKAKIILKRLFTGRFHDSAVKRDWDKSILKTDWD